MLPYNAILKTSNTAEQMSSVAPLQSSEQQLELPQDLFDYLENVPINFQELVEEDELFRDVLSGANNCQNNASRRASEPNVQSNEFAPSTVELIQPLMNEDVIVKLEEMSSISPISTHYVEENIQQHVLSPPSSLLRLNLQTAVQPNPPEHVTTPILIEMLLQNEEIVQQEQVADSDLPLTILPDVLQDIKVCSEPFRNKPIPPTRNRVTEKHLSTSHNSDLRRVRNNEASRKSRQNRRKKLQTQVQLVEILEDEGRRLTQKVKELESLKAEIMKYITSNKMST